MSNLMAARCMCLHVRVTYVNLSVNVHSSVSRFEGQDDSDELKYVSLTTRQLTLLDAKRGFFTYRHVLQKSKVRPKYSFLSVRTLICIFLMY